MITKSNSGACVISPRAAFRRRSITSGGSCPRWSRRARSASIDGGRMNTPTACGKCRLTCCAPCQSISSNTSLPSPRRCSIHWREVPYQLACTCAVSRNPPRALRAANSSLSTKWYSRPCASPDRGARVVNETDSRIAGSRFSSALTRLDLQLQLDGRVGHFDRGRLRAERIGLAIELLHQEIEPPADRPAGAQHAPYLDHVGAQALQFLVDVGAHPVQRHLLADPVVHFLTRQMVGA